MEREEESLLGEVPPLSPEFEVGRKGRRDGFTDWGSELEL